MDEEDKDKDKSYHDDDDKMGHEDEKPKGSHKDKDVFKTEDEARDRAFYSPYPHPVLAPLTIVTPPISRFILPPITSLLENDFENFWKYQFSTYLPFGRALRDTYRTIQSPAMLVEFSTGIPLHQFHTLSRDYFFNKDEELEQEDN